MESVSILFGGLSICDAVIRLIAYFTIAMIKPETIENFLNLPYRIVLGYMHVFPVQDQGQRFEVFKGQYTTETTSSYDKCGPWTL